MIFQCFWLQTENQIQKYEAYYYYYFLSLLAILKTPKSHHFQKFNFSVWQSFANNNKEKAHSFTKFAFISPSSIPSFPHLNETIPTNPFYYNNKGPYKKASSSKSNGQILIQPLIYNCIQYSHFLHLKRFPPN